MIPVSCDDPLITLTIEWPMLTLFLSYDPCFLWWPLMTFPPPLGRVIRWEYFDRLRCIAEAGPGLLHHRTEMWTDYRPLTWSTQAESLLSNSDEFIFKKLIFGQWKQECYFLASSIQIQILHRRKESMFLGVKNDKNRWRRTSTSSEGHTLYLYMHTVHEKNLELQKISENKWQTSHLVSARSLVRSIRLSRPSRKVYIFSIDIWTMAMAHVIL